MDRRGKKSEEKKRTIEKKRNPMPKASSMEPFFSLLLSWYPNPPRDHLLW
jgi:hypothetical protein